MERTAGQNTFESVRMSEELKIAESWSHAGVTESI